VLWLARDSSWVRNHENIFVIGPCGVGKSFLASALAHKACRDAHSALYLRAAALLRELALARADGGLRHLLARLYDWLRWVARAELFAESARAEEGTQTPSLPRAPFRLRRAPRAVNCESELECPPFARGTGRRESDFEFGPGRTRPFLQHCSLAPERSFGLLLLQLLQQTMLRQD